MRASPARRAERRRARCERLVPSAFRAHTLLANAHLQMAAGALLRSQSRQRMRIERLDTPDDDFIEIGWINETADGPIALLVHGLGGGLGSGYVHALAARLARHGWCSVVLQLRGAGAEPNRQPALFHHGDTEDFRWLCRRLRNTHPGRPLCAIGWSLGASIVVNALAEEGAESPLHCAAAVSVPLQLRRCAEHLRCGSARIYQDMMLTYIKDRLRRKYPSGGPAGVDLAAALAARDFFEFGDAFTAPLCGIADGVTYCERVDPGRALAAIVRPTLILQARDDPFLGPGTVPRLPVADSVRIELAERGGHVGFVTSGPWGSARSWLEDRLADFLLDQVAPSRAGWDAGLFAAANVAARTAGLGSCRASQT